MAKKFYITTSIPYTNASPHVGFAFEAIQSDVIARYHRFLGQDVYFLTGTDEHGLKTLRAAEAAGKEVLEFANEVSEKFRDLAKVLNISNTDFIRTTDEKRHLPAVYALWEKFKEKGDIYKKKYKGLYCEGCEAFKTEKEVTDGKCIFHPTLEIKIIEEENYFFKLSKYLPEIKKIIEQDSIKIIPESKKHEVLGMIEQGLEDVSFSRSREKYWGWPVPGDDDQVFYVWQDALPNYISAIGYGSDDKKFNMYWPADVHCIGKDIVKFHALYWPAMLLSAGLDLPKAIFVHGFINVDGQKMSKSLGNVVDPFELVKKYGVDAVRYFLLREISPTEDGDFSYEKFQARYNADLAGGVGNLLARTVTLAAKPNFLEKNPTSKIKKEIDATKKEYEKHLDGFKFNEALKSIWELISFCDKYINEQKPWEAKPSDSQVISDILFGLSGLAKMLEPFLPETVEKMKKVLAERKSEILFPRI
ncbi:MAG: methionine--tRNA ligase [Candidatus Staskawiczbacteria bacterium RIFCSPHIGHO2_02_FULL_42_22]|uniref:Methionine--tRNA ligase n=1 Tax=Candidatus Staskawiczbacteria bacterium RIFCSPHIGHO2_02_FULL_42_22 TaxID=1802207 RepID=A0A1G2I1M2_9BACT|nr:MAG: methionine--tRNA ligase [Candidatus Staskawiczbacteria bacterium RIFCSPHIGHO2_02_FULL_42_22]